MASNATVAALGLITIFTVGALVDGPTILGLDFPASVGLRRGNPEIVLFLMRVLPRLTRISRIALAVTGDLTRGIPGARSIHARTRKHHRQE